MPSRAPSCRHVARSIYNNNLSPLWITDDVLDNAFDRYLRVSRTAKRYGSSVPGPLEAQRRLAKRKMAGLATMGGPAAFDIGVLFGSGPPTSEELNWHAPAKKEDTKYLEGIYTRSRGIELAHWLILYRYRAAVNRNRNLDQHFASPANPPGTKSAG